MCAHTHTHTHIHTYMWQDELDSAGDQISNVRKTH